MKIRTSTLLLLAMLSVNAAFSQFDVNVGIHRHNDAFFTNYDAYGKPFVAYTMYSAGVGYTHKKLRWHMNASQLQYSTHLTGDFSGTSHYSHGGAGSKHVDNREADVQLGYTGIRAGMDVQLKRTEHFSFAIGLSEHVDILTREQVTNAYQTTYDVYPSYDHYMYINGELVLVHHQGGSTPPEKKQGTFPVVDCAEQYWYTNVALKPSFHFGSVTLELQFLLNFFATPRVINHMVNYLWNDSEERFYATALVGRSNYSKGLYVSSEIGICLKYTLGKIASE